LFDGPLSLTMPDLSLPNFNDSGVSPLASHAEIYELAAARYRDSAYASLISTNRSNRMALLFGVTDLAGGNLHTPAASRNLAGPGYAILDRGEGTNATWLGLKYGPHGGGHGHPDKNSFILYSRGEVIAPDVGTHAYGSPLHTGWDKTTLAHNTLVMDEKSQEPAEGKCIAFGSERGVDFSVTDAGPIYPGVRFIRTVVMPTPDLVVFIDQIESDTTHTFDLAYHQVGTWEDLPAGQPWSSKAGDGYKYFTDANVTEASGGNLALRTKIKDNWKSVITFAETRPTEVVTGYGIWKTTKDKVPMVVQRQHAQRTAYVWAVALDGKPAHLSAEQVYSGDKLLDRSQAVLVSVGGWHILANPQGKKVKIMLIDALKESDAIFSVW
jgi:hypothetical protein